MIVACSQKAISSFNPETETLLKKSSQILFLTLEAKKDTPQNTVSIKILQHRIMDGKLKFFDPLQAHQGKTGDWRISFQDNKTRTITSIFMDNPFIMNREAFGEDGKITRHTIKICESQIPIRLPYLQQMQKFQIDTLILSKGYDNIYQGFLPR